MTVTHPTSSLRQGLGDTLPLSALEPVSLADVVRRASLQHRVDRKYMVSLDTAHRLIEMLVDSHSVLTIDNRLSTTYRSTYFDTPTFSSSRSHVQRRRLRWKVRSRLYVEDDLCRIEVKTKDGRGATIKTVGPSSAERYAQLVGTEHDFVRAALAADHPEVEVDRLVPTSEITYARTSLADIGAGTRVTLDWKLLATLSGGAAWIDENYVLIETKGGTVPARADRVLTSLGSRPRSFSKYVAATSLIRPEIPDNDFRQLRRTSLHCRLTHPSTNGSS